MPKLITLVGFPGVGKSTYAQQLVAQGFRLISGDEVIESTRQKYGLSSADEAYSVHKEEINAAMDAQLQHACDHGDSMVVDALNLSRRHRSRHLDAVRASAHDYQCEALVFYPPEAEEHAARLGTRALLQGRMSMADGLQMQRWENAYEAPSQEEGFARVTFIGTPPKEALMVMGR